METNDWTPRVLALEAAVQELKDSLLGTLDGKPGMRSQVDQLMQLTRQNGEQLDGLRLDKAKAAGIILATGFIVGLGLKLLHL